jgi:hypothetical protein
MPKHKKEEVDARIEEVGRQRARRVPVAECARRFDVSERQIRDDQREWLKRRKAERATEGLEVEERLVANVVERPQVRARGRRPAVGGHPGPVR